MATVTLEQLKAPPLATVEVYLQRFKGLVVLQELSGEQVLKAGKWAQENLPGTDDVKIVNQSKYRSLLIALALKEPRLGGTDEEIAAASGIVGALPYQDQMLLQRVHDKLTDNTLTEEQRQLLKEEKSAIDLWKGLGGGDSLEANLEALDSADVEMVLAVGLRVPEVLTQQVAMSTVRLLYERLEREREEDAQRLAGVVMAALAAAATE